MRLRGFLSPLKPGARHHDTADRLTPRTGNWFLEDPKFKGWVGIVGSEEANRSHVLCCLGNPGVGKTGLAYAVPLSLEAPTNLK